MNGFGKNSMDHGRFSDSRRKYYADKEIKEVKATNSGR
jgi:hypothetical protein